MKHYLYKIFPNTLLSVCKRYLAKYGAEATVKEEATTRVSGTTKTTLGLEIGANDVGSATMTRPALKKGEEAHDDVIVNGRWCASPPGLAMVKPWDVLMPMGHGGITSSDQIMTNECYSDVDMNQASTSRTLNDLVKWFGQDQLDKNHVLIKLIMCFSGGSGKTGEVTSDCFARNLAMAMDKAGW